MRTLNTLYLTTLTSLRINSLPVQTFLSLVRLGADHSASVRLQEIDWPFIEFLAAQHGLSALVLDGIERIPEEKRPNRAFLMPWVADVAQNFESRYDQYCKAMAEMARFYTDHGFKMMVLKGYACCLDWPKPNHRPCGDIDIWQFGKYKEADEAITREKGIKVSYSHHHHSVFYWRSYMVENHYHFINIYHHRSNVEYEKMLKELGMDDSYSTELYGQKVYLPSPNFHSLFLLKHSFAHFASTGISLKQVLDWGFHVQAHSSEIDWPWLVDILNCFGMHQLFSIFNAICVEDLGFDASLFPELRFSPMLKDRVLAEILSPEFSGETPAKFFPRIVFKYRRWRANAWKHRLCYRESLWSAFWSGVWNHLLKPASI